jgi:predicted molibdopterin-dependent oxidoreductase YjgC
VGANPLRGRTRRARFLVVHELFLTETARLADVVLPALSAYEKEGTVTNVCGEVQRLKPAAQFMGAKTDLEIMRLIAREMGAAVEETPRGTCFSLCAAGEIRSARNGLFASGTMGEYCHVFGTLLEGDQA